MKRIRNTLVVVIAAAALGTVGVTAHATEPTTAPLVPSPASGGVPPSEMTPQAKAMAAWLDSHLEFKARGYEYWVWTWRNYFVVRWPGISAEDRAMVVAKGKELKLELLSILDPTTRP